MEAEEFERLRLVLPPVPYSTLWLALAVVLAVVAVGWVVGLFVWTLPIERLRRTPVLRDITLRLLKRKFSRSIDATVSLYQRGQLSSRAAHGAVSRALRLFVQLWTGEPASRMVLAEFAESHIAEAAAALEALYPGQFAPQEQPDVARSARAAKEVLAAWR
ncbi:hypothetical protein [Segniliparus rugosus]|uniref:Uncharacterized protein n=1 Tax=Segniliparus rugosus (strain ATCC BAA-974 / DSM 45345 / CCUG 50838 / CIP 108380 / JCM 13579 / CDC 945) TaxID=679197 RepID=E5XQ47_SEGRC|nr:hypothetical protein [Segniliparus rugosus]EFV13520.1 hypothetical protein HMPREF9336_01619 [Segniliparus rugosus ATCC BAA-974]